jgi:hypothetical protein
VIDNGENGLCFKAKRYICSYIIERIYTGDMMIEINTRELIANNFFFIRKKWLKII